MTSKQARYVLAGAAAAVALAAAYVATRATGPVPMTAYTEQRRGPLQEHLVTLEELGLVAAVHPHRYPTKVCPNVTSAVWHGFGPLHQLPDPQVAALPAEAD